MRVPRLTARGLHCDFPAVPEPGFYPVALMFRNTMGRVFNLNFTVIGFAGLWLVVDLIAGGTGNRVTVFVLS